MKVHFTIRPLFALLAATAILSPAVFAQGRGTPAPDNDARLVDEKSGSFTVRDGQRLRLFTDIGNIRVRTQNSGQLSYRVRIEADAHQPGAQQYLSKFVLSARSVPDGVSISARVPWREFRGRLWVTFELNIPRNFQLDLTTQAGNIETESIEGRISLVTAGGNLTAARVGGPARLETQGGHITVQDVAADLSAVSAGGHLTVGNVQGDAVIRTGGGHIRVASVKGAAQLETSGGNISLERAGAGIIVHTGGGRIDLGETWGAIRASTAGGNIGVLKVVGPTQLDTGGGSICLTKVQGAIRASTSAGTITAWFVPEDKGGAKARPYSGPSQLESGAGDILVYIPRELAITIDATVESPSENHIDADPAIPLKVTYSGSGSSGRMVRGEAALNGGGEVLRLRTITGNIRLRYSDSPRLSIEPDYDLQRRQIEYRLKMHQEEFARQFEKQQEFEQQARAKAKELEREMTRLQEWQWKILSLWSDRLRVNSAEQKQRLTRSVAPIYPPLAKQRYIEGLVRLEVYVSREGAVEDIKVLSGNMLLVPAAVEAVKQWRYTPVAVDGKPVPVVTTIDIEFRLN
ncbi:MAG: TonB family protein [Acidobacteria bacterium]|nr:TonB family protein [Acidobacteriota bacterium]MBI3664460.1 TonB family protein [Acidobacteriota bacterium]